MGDDNLATTPIRELITSFRKQIEELPMDRLIDKLFISTITNRFEEMADLIVESRDYIGALHREHGGLMQDEHQEMVSNALSLMSRLGDHE